MSVKGTVSDGEDTVIEVGSASGGDDTGSVRLEGHLIGFDGNGDWSDGKGGLHLGGGVSNIGEGGDSSDTLGFVVVAAGDSTSTGGVWVFSLGGLSVGGNVFHTLGLPSTSASIAGGVARDELLFGKAQKVSTLLDELSGLHGGGG